MIFTQNSILLVLSLVSTAHSLQRERSDNPGFLKLDFNVTNRGSKGVNPSLLKRGVYSSSLTDDETSGYELQLLFGSDKQQVTVGLDTGSSDLWAGPSYNPDTSSSAEDLKHVFQIQYGSGPVNGEYYGDQVQLPGGPTLTNVTLGSAPSASSSIESILGVNFVAGETASDDGQPAFPNHPNFPVILKDQGFISKVAYSIYLNDYLAPTGSIIFGGIDTAKAESLTVRPIVNPSRLAINLTSLTATDGTVLSAPPGTAGILDTGTSITYLPDDIVQGLAKTIPGASYDPDSGQINLSQPLSSGQNLTYNLSGVEINVPLDQLQIPNGPDSSFLGIVSNILLPDSEDPTGNTKFTILGDTFLRSAYIVFDLEDRNVQIGQARYTTDSNIVAIE